MLALIAAGALAIFVGMFVAVAMLRLSGNPAAPDAPEPARGAAVSRAESVATQPQQAVPTASASTLAAGEPRSAAADAAGSGANRPAVAVAAPLAPSRARAELVRLDDQSGGGWVGQYGKLGYRLAMPGEPTRLPPAVSLRMNGGHLYIWSALTTDRRALSVPSEPARLSAAQWFDWDHFSIDLDLRKCGRDVQVALYLLDWDTDARGQRLEVADADTGAVLLTRTDDHFRNGRYVIVRLAGHVVLRFTKTAGANCTLSGIFLDGVAPAP